MSFAFTGTLLPLIRDYVDKENETWLGEFTKFDLLHCSDFTLPYVNNLESGVRNL